MNERALVSSLFFFFFGVESHRSASGAAHCHHVGRKTFLASEFDSFYGDLSRDVNHSYLSSPRRHCGVLFIGSLALVISTYLLRFFVYGNREIDINVR